MPGPGGRVPGTGGRAGPVPPAGVPVVLPDDGQTPPLS